MTMWAEGRDTCGALDFHTCKPVCRGNDRGFCAGFAGTILPGSSGSINGVENTGGGGGSGNPTGVGGLGGSGIVVIRNARPTA